MNLDEAIVVQKIIYKDIGVQRYDVYKRLEQFKVIPVITEVVLAVGGSWVAKRDRIASGDWKAIKQNCMEIKRVLKAPG